MSAATKPLPFPDLPPGVRLERAERWHTTRDVWGNVIEPPAIPDDAQWLLTDATPHSPSRFILGRYPTIEAAQADAWDRMTAHDAYVKRLAAQLELRAARSAEKRLHAKGTRPPRKTKRSA